MKYINYLNNNIDISIIPATHPEYNFFHQVNSLYLSAGRYLNTCIMQFNRIETWMQERTKRGSHAVHLQKEIDFNLIFSDIHFLLIALDKCYKLEGVLYRLLLGRQKEASFVSNDFVNDIRIMRNTLEHLEENLLKYNKNDTFSLPDEYKINGWCWSEYQISSLCNGVFRLKDKELVFSNTMFNSAIIPLDEIANAFSARISCSI